MSFILHITYDLLNELLLTFYTEHVRIVYVPFSPSCLILIDVKMNKSQELVRPG